VLVVFARPAIEAAKTATNEQPIVAFGLESDPEALGYVASWATPGGNLTGLFLEQPGITGKWLEPGSLCDKLPNFTRPQEGAAKRQPMGSRNQARRLLHPCPHRCRPGREAGA
jgi:hypothetical protein